MPVPGPLTSPSVQRALLARAGIRPRRRWGQNFLSDANILRRVVTAAELTPVSRVLEIGAGLGALTRELATRAAAVLAVEIDPALCRLLRDELLADVPHVRLIEGDVLRLDLSAALAEALGPPPYSAVANLPYSITSPAIVALLELDPPLQRIVVLVQREVADRLLATPGSGAYGSLTLFARYHAAVERIALVSRHCFHPAPEVDSAIVRFTPHAQRPFPDVPRERLLAVTRAAFGQRRKTLLNALTGGGFAREGVVAALATAGIDSTRRAETLALEEFAALARALSV